MKKYLLILIAIFGFGFLDVSAQDGFKIVTKHPDFKIKIKRCVASDKTVILDMVFLNVGDYDSNRVSLNKGCGEAYDDQGNVYTYKNFRVSKAANSSEVNIYGNYDFSMLSNIPVNISMIIENVPTIAESIARIRITHFSCKEWSISPYDKSESIEIYNVPITRD